MKPTLKQLKERPALWVYSSVNYVEPRITMPDKTIMWAYYSNFNVDWDLRTGQDYHQFALTYYEFGGWI